MDCLRRSSAVSSFRSRLTGTFALTSVTVTDIGVDARTRGKK